MNDVVDVHDDDDGKIVCIYIYGTMRHGAFICCVISHSKLITFMPAFLIFIFPFLSLSLSLLFRLLFLYNSFFSTPMSMPVCVILPMKFCFFFAGFFGAKIISIENTHRYTCINNLSIYDHDDDKCIMIYWKLSVKKRKMNIYL